MRAFLFVGICLLLASCFDKGDCLFTNTNFVKVKIMNADTPSIAKVVPFDSVVIANHLLYFPDSAATMLTIALDPNTTETEVVFAHEKRSDTLVLGYTTQTRVLSPDCGSYNYISELSVIYSTFGTNRVIITEPRLLNTAQINVEIYL